MKINNIIKEILLENDKVVVPNIGEFAIIYKSAQTESNGRIIPPSKQIVFDNTKITDLSNSLFNFIKKETGGSDAETNKLIEDFVKATEAKLKLNQEVVFDEIGNLYATNTGEYRLKNTFPDSILIAGLGMTDITPPKQLEKNTKVQKDTKTTKTTKTKTKKSNKTLKRMLIALPIIILLVLAVIFYKDIWSFSNKFIADNFQKNKNENVDTNNTNITKNVDTTEKITPDVDTTTEVVPPIDTTKTDNNIENTEKTDDEIIEDSKIDNVQPDNLGTEYKPYYLIVGSFNRQRNAERKVEKMKNAGYTAEILKNREGFFRVAIGGYDKANQAVSDYDSFLAKYPNEDIWLLINK